MILRSLPLAACLFALGLALSPQAGAADDRGEIAKARAHFERGERLFKVSRYREALDEFKEAFVTKADPVFLYNIAQCHRLLGDRGEALTFYRRYLQAAPESRNRAEVERRIRELTAAAAAEPPPASSAPATAPPALEPGRVESQPAPPAPRPAAPALASQRPAPQPAPVAAVSGTRPPDDDDAAHETPFYGRWWFWGLVGTAVAAGVVGAVMATRPAKEPTCADPCLR